MNPLYTTFDFSHQLAANASECVCKHFDELMVLYHLVGVRDNTKIRLDDCGHDVSFRVTMNSASDASDLFGKINDTFFNVCGIRFHVNMDRKRNVLFTYISKT